MKALTFTQRRPNAARLLQAATDTPVGSASTVSTTTAADHAGILSNPAGNAWNAVSRLVTLPFTRESAKRQLRKELQGRGLGVLGTCQHCWGLSDLISHRCVCWDILTRQSRLLHIDLSTTLPVFFLARNASPLCTLKLLQKVVCLCQTVTFLEHLLFTSIARLTICSPGLCLQLRKQTPTPWMPMMR